MSLCCPRQFFHLLTPHLTSPCSTLLLSCIPCHPRHQAFLLSIRQWPHMDDFTLRHQHDRGRVTDAGGSPTTPPPPFLVENTRHGSIRPRPSLFSSGSRSRSNDNLNMFPRPQAIDFEPTASTTADAAGSSSGPSGPVSYTHLTLPTKRIV